MSKYNRYNSVITRTDEYVDDDYWLRKIEKQLEKSAVQPRSVDKSLFEQITTIMNGKPKYTSVEAAVEDMKNRSGLTEYLNKIKISESVDFNTKVASENQELPVIIKEYPEVGQTIKNIIDDVHGNLPVMVVINKAKNIHYSDVSDETLWDDDDLIIYVSSLKLQANKNVSKEENHNLGKRDRDSSADIDPSNTDAFFGLNPVKT